MKPLTSPRHNGVRATNLGYPRIGADRELKQAVEAYWRGDLSEEELREKGRALRVRHWKLQQERGLDHVPSNDFSFYDQVLDAAAMVGAVPPRFAWDGETVDLSTYFAMARGTQEKQLAAGGEQAGAPAMEMTKWFDTNYHYIVPEFSPGQDFHLASRKPIEEFREALEAAVHTRPVLLGPVSFLLLGKTQEADVEPLDLLDRLLPVYAEVLQELDRAGAGWMQLDEPCLVLDLEERTQVAFRRAYAALGEAAPALKLLVATYFGGLRDNLPLALDLPVAALHLDLVRAPEQLAPALKQVPEEMSLSLGLIDGRNVWRADLDAKRSVVQEAVARLGKERVLVAPSCSLLHVPVDVETESGLDEDIRRWLAFAKQKIEEVVALSNAVSGRDEQAAPVFTAGRKAQEHRQRSERVHDADVQARVQAIASHMTLRESSYAERRAVQQEQLGLPPLPTTTIGSFPQTQEIRRMRSAYKRGEIDREEYEAFLEAQIEDTIRRQEEIGLDVLVHGEPERGDMVAYFGRQLEGVLFTENGWVQSYGTRCVRPPVIYGDVARPEPMTVRWLRYAQSLTEQPVKGMLTGPVTILQWSFVRDDQLRAETCRQIALAVREEVKDLEAAGIRIIQIDEPAFREGLPLHRADWDDYLDWAVECFRLASGGAHDETQIHTHMCYSEFNDIVEAIAAMDADVISIESSRSKMELLAAFEAFDYPNGIGPGVYDIHSPRVPSVEEIEQLLQKALRVLRAEQLWVNPDCGLKTRRWQEAVPALKHMVQAAHRARESLTAPVS